MKPLCTPALQITGCLDYPLLKFKQETEIIVSQVLDELGISLDHELSDITPGLDKPHVAQSSAPVSHTLCICGHCDRDILILQKKAVAAAGPAGSNTDDLQARLDQLRRGDDD